MSYLGSRFTETLSTLEAVKHRICCAESIVTRLNPRVFSRNAVPSVLKGRFVSSAVFASLLYGLQYCSFNNRDRCCLDGFYLRLVKRILRLPHNYHLSYQEAFIRTGVERPSLRLKKHCLSWIGHVLRSEEPVLKEVLLFIPEGGKRGRGRPRYRFYDTIKADLKDNECIVGIKKQSAFWNVIEQLSSDRIKWRKNIVECCA